MTEEETYSIKRHIGTNNANKLDKKTQVSFLNAFVFNLVQNTAIELFVNIFRIHTDKVCLI